MEFGQLPSVQIKQLINNIRTRVPDRIWFFGAVAVIAVAVGVTGAIGLKNGLKNGQISKNGKLVKIEEKLLNPVQHKKNSNVADSEQIQNESDEVAEVESTPDPISEAKQPSEPQVTSEPEPDIPYEEALPETVHESASLPQATPEIISKEPVIVPYKGIPAWRKNALQLADLPPGPQIAIVIDDAGIDRRRTAQAIKLPGPLTIAFLTYAGALEKQSAAARAEGHEIMVHMPMQPMSNDVDPGPNVLTPDAAPEETLKRVIWGLDRFKGFVGVNNHMGSRFTENVSGMEILLRELKRRGLLFLDSRTSTKSVGAGIALALDLPFAERNVFLDNVPEVAAVNKQLKLLENVARRQGYAIAIGHPRDATIFALSQWLAVIAEKGFVQVPISAIVARRYGTAQATEVKN